MNRADQTRSTYKEVMKEQLSLGEKQQGRLLL